jgi:RNA polymerase sigma factor (sigma-70 family)
MKSDGADTLKTRPTLLSKVRKGDEDGWCQFYELYQDFIYAAARGAGLAHEESKDVVQEAMLTVRNYLDRFVPDANRGRFRTWLRRIVHSRIADQYRKKKRNPLANAPKELPTEDSATSVTNRIPDLSEVELDRLVDGKLEQAIFAEARKRVKEKVRMEDYQTYDLFEVQELCARDVALSLTINVTTVRVRAFRVRHAIEREVRRIARMLEQPNRHG